MFLCVWLKFPPTVQIAVVKESTQKMEGDWVLRVSYFSENRIRAITELEHKNNNKR